VDSRQNITFNTLHYSQPAYLHFLLCFHTPACSLRSSDANLLTILFIHPALGARSFSVASPKICNSLSSALCSCNCPNTFRWHLKSHYFQQAFSFHWASPCYTSDSAFAEIVHVYKFHLLTCLLTGQSVSSLASQHFGTPYWWMHQWLLQFYLQ